MKTLDLHGIKHSDVPRILDQFVWEQMKNNTKEIEIITGISDIMKKIVIETIDDYQFTYDDAWNNPGSLIVRLV